MQKTVLIVEDDDEIGRLLELLLSQETPYQTCLVHSAQEALWVVQEVKPVLFLFDYYLPGMTGLQLYDQLHAQQEFAAIPAIIISANLPMKELAMRHLVGLAKPFDLDPLLDAIEQVVG